MYRQENGLGKAVACLIHGEDDKTRIQRRFNVLATSADIQELAHHLRGMIQLLRSEGIPLDYPELAKDLYLYQNEDYRSQVRLRWGQDFYRRKKQQKQERKIQMNKKNFYVDIHVLQNRTPSCVNRDDTGSPKTAVYGGATRARVSSQSWKHAMRAMFSDIFEKKTLEHVQNVW